VLACAYFNPFAIIQPSLFKPWQGFELVAASFNF
jgi:hypothetical protein